MAACLHGERDFKNGANSQWFLAGQWHRLEPIWTSGNGVGHAEAGGLNPVIAAVEIFNAALNSGVEAGFHLEGLAPGDLDHLAVAHDQLTILEHELGGSEHRGLILLIGIHCNITNGARAQVSTVGESEQSRWSGTGDDGDLRQGKLAGDSGQIDDFTRLGRNALDPARTFVAIHEQMDDLRVANEKCAIGMVGREQHAQEIIGKQHDLESDCTLHSMHDVMCAVYEGHDAGAVALTLNDLPLLWAREAP